MTNKPGEFEVQLKELLIDAASQFWHNHNNTEQRVQIVRQKHDEILKLVKGLLPEAPKEVSSEFYEGVVSCRLSILKALGVES